MKAVVATDFDFQQGKDFLDSGKYELVIVELPLDDDRKALHAMVKEGDKSALFENAHQGWVDAYLNERKFEGYKAYYRLGPSQPLKVFLGQLREVFQEEIELEEATGR